MQNCMDLTLSINRCGLLTGANQWGKSSQGLMSYFVYKALKNELISITGFKGSGLQVRDFLNIKDLVNLLDLQIKIKILIKMLFTMLVVG